MQAGLGAGLNVASMCFWGWYCLRDCENLIERISDKQTDHSFVVRWESKAVIAVCNVYALRLDHLMPTAIANVKNENASDVEQHVSNGASSGTYLAGANAP
jgi:hypothetical protein